MTLKLKRILISILCVLLFVCGAVALNFNATNSTFNASADIIETAIPDVNDFYFLNDKKVFPNTVNNVKVNPDDAESPVIEVSNGVIFYPNGTAYAIEENKEFLLNLLGNYKLRYFGEHADKAVVAEKTFSVINDLYGISQDNASFIDFATADYFTEYSETYNEGKTGNDVLSPHSYASHNLDDSKLTHSGKDALSINLQKDTEFFYSKPIDLRKADGNGLTDIISFEPRAEDWNYTNDADKDGEIDKTTAGKEKFSWALEKIVARKLVIKLTDCYDSSRYIKMVVDTPKAVETTTLDKLNSGNFDKPNIRACTDTLIKEWGLDSSERTTKYLNGRSEYTEHGNKTLIYDGTKIQAWTASSSMKWFYGGDFGGYNYRSVDYSYLNIKYDYEKSQLYCSSTNKNGSESDPIMFTDFYNQELYPASTGTFREFTTGEVFLSIGFDGYVLENDTARVDVFSIGDTSMSDLFNQPGFNPELENATSQHKFTDDVKPAVNVDFTPTTNGGVFVAVGDKFTLPSATASDVYLSGGVFTKAYVNYGKPSQFEVPIVDGKLLVEYPDTYHIVYAAKDYSGNIGEKVIKVFGFNADSTIGIAHDTAQFANIVAGQEYDFVVPSSITTHNINDTLQLKIEFVSDYETIVLADCKSYAEIQEFLQSSPKFKLSSVNEYTIKYYLADNAYNNYHDPITYKFNVGPSNVFAIYQQPFMYRYYIKGAKYDFDNIDAYGFTENKPSFVGKAELWLNFDGQGYVKQNSVYGIKITGSQTVQAKYVYGNAVVETPVSTIVDVDFPDDTAKNKKVSMYKYFVGDAFNFSDIMPDGTENKFSIYYQAKQTTGNAKLEYILPVDISDFTFSFSIKEDFGNIGGVRITFTDVYDPNNKISVYQYKEGDKLFARYNDNKAIQLPAGSSFVGSVDNVITYKETAQALSLSTYPSKYIYTTEKFEGLVYLEIELCDITGTAGIMLNRLVQKQNDMKLSKIYTDSLRPAFVGDLPTGTYNVGDKITISPATFIDNTSVVIKENVSFEVKFGNEHMKSVDNIVLDGSQDPTRSYEVVLPALGTYTISYSAEDSFKRAQSANFTISVVDNVAPEITFNGDIKENVIVYAETGYELNLDFTVSDNNTATEALTYVILILNKHTAAITAVQEKIFTFNYAGTYEVSVVCYDIDNNIAEKTFTVVVSDSGVGN